MKSLLIMIILTEALTQSIEDDLYRRSYGQSFNDGCPNYEMVYKCMSICKKINGVYRINRRCQCRCHSTTSKLKYLKKKTNGTTIKIPKTFSPGIFDIVGTFSIPYYLITTTTTTSPNVTCKTTKPPINSTTPSSKGIQDNNFPNSVTNKTIPENNIIHNNKSSVYNINRNTRITSTVKVKSSSPHGVLYGNNFTTPNANENITASGSNGNFTAPPQSIVNNSDTIITSKDAKEKVEKEKDKDQVEKEEKKIGGDVEKNKDIGEDKMENRDEQDETREEKVKNVGNPEGITETLGDPNVTTQGSENEPPEV